MPRKTNFDIVGKKFGRLTVLSFQPSDGKYAKFLCKCECGGNVTTMGQSLLSGNTRSCGCLKKEATSIACTKHGHNGKNRTRTYNSWASMMTRGVWGNHESWHQYGAIGKGVCPEWHDFKKFLADMGERPPGTSIDRKDNNLGYSKENCRWATRREQALNTSRTIKVIYEGEVTCVFDLCETLSLSKKAVRSRADRRGGDYVAALRSMGIAANPNEVGR